MINTFAKMVKKYLKTLKWDILLHSLYSPDVVPSDYYLFDRWTTASLTSTTVLMKYLYT